ncbi:MAG: hypothetical protein LBN01_03285 [Endomicrobium sp.]|jgi:plasmid maintenance system killer protein|nr:hypothetical protein [Endomicrobium sp.]
MINQAMSLSDLKIPPANQLEKLHGNRIEQIFNQNKQMMADMFSVSK